MSPTLTPACRCSRGLAKLTIAVPTHRLCVGALAQVGDKYAVAHLHVLAIDDHYAQEALLAHLYCARLGELIKDEFGLRAEKKLSH